MEYQSEREELAYFMRRLYERGLTTTSGGNLSWLLTPDRVLVTPAAQDKARTQAADILVLDRAGNLVAGRLRPTSETSMHLAIYEARPDVRAVVHAHPVTASAFTAAATPIDCRLLGESYALAGDPLLVPYARTGTLELARLVGEAARRADSLLLRHHGITTVGDSLLRAFDRLELLEAAARMTLICRRLDGVCRLNEEQCRELDLLMGRQV